MRWLNKGRFKIECLFGDSSDGCRNTRLMMIKIQLAAGAIMATTCVLYFILYCIATVRASKTDQSEICTVANVTTASIYPQSALSVGLSEHQAYAVYPHSYQPSVPFVLSDYPQLSTQVSPGINNMNFLSFNQESAIYPKISHAQI